MGLALLSFAAPLSQVPNALADATGPQVATVFATQSYSNQSVQHFFVIFDEPVVDATENMVLVDGSAMNCQRVPFSNSGTMFDIAVSGCSDGELRVGIAASTVRDSLGGLGPNQTSWSAPMHISRAIPNFGLGGLVATRPGVFEFHLYAPTGILTTNAAAFNFDYSTCQASQVAYFNTDITYEVTGCPSDVALRVSVDPYSFFDWYANAGPASQVVSEPITLSSAVQPAPMPVPTVSASPSLSPQASSSPSDSAAPATATLAQMLGLGDGPTPPDVVATSQPLTQPTDTSDRPSDTEAPSDRSETASDNTVTVSGNQDEPVGSSVGLPLTDAVSDALSDAEAPTLPSQTYKSIQLKFESNDSARMLGAAAIAIGSVVLLVVTASQLRRIRVKRTRVAFS